MLRGRVTALAAQAHNAGMAEAQFRAFFNEQTGRWDVLWKHPDGVESVVGAYSTREEAEEHVARANKPEAPHAK